MSSRRVEQSDHAVEEFWRPLAQRCGWAVSAAAQDLGSSVCKLERRCQQELGTTPHDFFHRERMTTAARLLTSGQTIKFAALTLGYSQPANFSRDFKRHHGRPSRLFAPARDSAS